MLGPNGAGKSTLLKVLLGLTAARRARSRSWARRRARRNAGIGYLPQRRAFDPSVRIRGIDLVRLGLDGASGARPVPWLSRLVDPARHREREQRLREVIELVGASAYAHRPIGQCSGGEQQRLLIAQALIRRPRLLLLDEPLDSLDVPSQAGHQRADPRHLPPRAGGGDDGRPRRQPDPAVPGPADLPGPRRPPSAARPPR